MFPTLGRAGKRCWAWARPPGLPAPREPHRRRRPRLRERLSNEIREKRNGNCTRSGGLLESTVAAAAGKNSRPAEKVSGGAARGEADLWKESAWPVSAALFLVAG